MEGGGRKHIHSSEHGNLELSGVGGASKKKQVYKELQMVEAIVSIVVGRLTDLLTEEPQLLHGVSDEIQQVVTDLRRIKTFLPDADSRISQDNIRILLAEVRELAYGAEHVVETFLVKASSSTKKAMQWMNTRTFLRKITGIHKNMSLLSNQFRDCNIKSTLESPESSNATHGTPEKLKRFHTFTTVEPEIFVGFQADVDGLVGHLVDESDDSYPLISICGMGGLGKTTLAEKIYNHTAIKNYFAGLAWVPISQKWQVKQVLQQILICLVHEKKEEILKMDEDKLVENLLQIQQQKKCLIVLDDIWSKDAWDSIKAAFTAEKSLSKLMLTSRNVYVAGHVNSKGLIHQPGYLTAEQSWELLRLKALPRGDYLDITRDVKRMEELGREMVANCSGLPLAIVILGGILVTKPSLIEWEKVHKDSLLSLKSGKGLGVDYHRELLDVLVWSYNDLPPQLKPCFLYLGKFSEDELIRTETLYQLWIAEGMILSSDRREGETMMQVAESYMGELVHKSMVQVRFNYVESSVLKFKSCSLHDLVRDMSLSLAKAQDFFKVIDLRERNDHDLNPLVNSQQLVVYFDERNKSKTNPYLVKKANQRRCRSVLPFNEFNLRSLHVSGFRFLRVLSLDDVCILGGILSRTLSCLNLGRALGNLVYLRYLSVRTTQSLIFPSIQNLVLLQTFKFRTRNDVYFPPWLSGNILEKLGRLRHLYLPKYWVWRFAISTYPKLRFDRLSKLETLDNFHTQWCDINDLPKLTSLWRLKLQVVVTSSDDVKEMMTCLSEIAFSSTSCLRYLTLRILMRSQGLESDPVILRQLLRDQKFICILKELTISGKQPEAAQLFEHQLHNNLSLICITKLTLWHSDMKEDPMPVLEKIPVLRVLHIYKAYMGMEMVCSAMDFQKLTELRLWEMPNLEKWRVEEGSMPILTMLMICDAPKLEDLPEGLRFLNFLQTLVLNEMPSVFNDRVCVVNGKEGPDCYKVAHIPDLQIY